MMRLVSLIFSLALISIARAADGRSEFDAGNQAYEQGRFAEAAAHYRAAVSNGVVGEGAWFNLGNAEFKSGELGRAIFAYRRAEQMAPRDAALRANLQFVRKKATGEDDPRVPLLRQLLRFATPNEWAALASMGVGLFFVVLAVGEFRGARVGRGTLLFFIVIAGGLSLIAAGSFYDRYVRREAVVLVKQSAVRFGPLEDSQTAFQLSAGTELQIIDATPTWFQLRDATGRSGWIKRSDVAIISP